MCIYIYIYAYMYICTYSLTLLSKNDTKRVNNGRSWAPLI